MAPADKTNYQWSQQPDRACTHCRERKIKCGREKPQCSNCKRDGVECGYMNPGKRVNHIKLLCNNVGGLEERLGKIEGELCRLNVSLEKESSSRSSVDRTTDDDSSTTHSSDDQQAEEKQCYTPTGRHIVRSQSDLADRYHGPCTLLSLCSEFRHRLLLDSSSQSWTFPTEFDLSSRRGSLESPGKAEDVKDILSRMCAEANTEDSFDLQPDQNPIRLPPKQFLMVVQNQFFQQADSVTDVFVQSAFRANVEHIYSRPVTAADEAWAIIFNTVILLVLGSEVSAGGAEPLIGSQFARPFLVTLRTALSNPRVLMATKLINVQALALLSVAAQKYYPSGVAESIFAQACVLARSMGLHQAHATSDGVSAEETEERMKTFKSLYLRDKSFSISRGSICWLPSFDCGLSPALGQESFVEPNWNARLQLAKLQEEVYRHFHSAEPETQSPAKHRSTLKRIEQNLEKWADAHGIFSSSATGIRDVDIRLEFLAARICAFRDSLEESHRRQALIDSKASCLLLLISYGKHDSSMVEQLENLPLSKNQLKAPGRIAGPNGVAKERSGEQSPLLSHSLLDTFSNPAPFLLVRNFLESKAEDDPPDESDMNLLQRVCSCYKEVDGKTQANNHTRQFGSAIERLLEIVEVAKTPDLSQMPLDGADDNATLPSTFATQDLFNDAARAMPDFNDLPPSSSAFGMPSPIFWETFSSDSNKNSSAPSDTTSSGGPPTGFLTPLDSEFINVPHDPLQNSFPASFPSQPNGEVPSRKRPRYNSTAPTDQTMEFIAE